MNCLLLLQLLELIHGSGSLVLRAEEEGKGLVEGRKIGDNGIQEFPLHLGLPMIGFYLCISVNKELKALVQSWRVRYPFLCGSRQEKIYWRSFSVSTNPETAREASTHCRNCAYIRRLLWLEITSKAVGSDWNFIESTRPICWIAFSFQSKGRCLIIRWGVGCVLMQDAREVVKLDLSALELVEEFEQPLDLLIGDAVGVQL